MTPAGGNVPPPVRRDRHTLAVAAIVTVQAIGAVFFVADAVGDVVNDGFGIHIAIEGLIAFALLAGVGFGARQVRTLLNETKRKEEALAIASGALADLIRQRFAQWQLTPAEADVAFFALKGCKVAEIAALRNATQGTVRAQLTHVYAKAGVTSHAGLACLFFEDLLGAELGTATLSSTPSADGVGKEG